jgi:D-threo-aldose 1-dehydrogenase
VGARATTRHTLGSTGVPVTRLGFGCGPLGGLFRPVGDDDARAVLETALANGIGYFDVAPLYGHGLAEERLGSVLGPASGLADGPVTVSTKVGRVLEAGPPGSDPLYPDAPLRAVFDFSRDGILRSFESSLGRLGRDRVDVLYLHDPDDHEDNALRVAYPVLRDLRAQGAVGAIGVGMNSPRVPTRFVRETDLDVVLLAGAYTLLDRSGADELLPACLARGVSVVVGSPYRSGLLANPYGVPGRDFFPGSAGLVDRARALDDACAAYGVPLKAAAIQFPLRHPAVAGVLAGARGVAEFEENLAMFDVDVPVELWDALEESA